MFCNFSRNVTKVCQNVDYYPRASKSSLIVKGEYKHTVAQIIIRRSKIKITAQGARHLIAVSDKLNFKKENIHNIVNNREFN